MKTDKRRISHFSLVCENHWLIIECRCPLRSLGRLLALVALAAATAWGGPELMHFVQMLVGQ